MARLVKTFLSAESHKSCINKVNKARLHNSSIYCYIIILYYKTIGKIQKDYILYGETFQ